VLTFAKVEATLILPTEIIRYLIVKPDIGLTLLNPRKCKSKKSTKK